MLCIFAEGKKGPLSASRKAGGWQEVAESGYRALPIHAKDYLEFVSKTLKVPIYMVSVGPGRENTIVLKDIFGRK